MPLIFSELDSVPRIRMRKEDDILKRMSGRKQPEYLLLWSMLSGCDSLCLSLDVSRLQLKEKKKKTGKMQRWR